MTLAAVVRSWVEDCTIDNGSEVTFVKTRPSNELREVERWHAPRRSLTLV